MKPTAHKIGAPSSNPAVGRIKEAGARLIDAMTKAEEASMWGVKAVTAPERIELNAGPAGTRVVIHALGLPVAAHALQGRTVTVEVVPPPGPGGLLPSRDGRRQRVPDVRALVDRLNHQDVRARVDRDHQSEPTSKTYIGTTAAGGWLSSYRANARGGIDADMALSDEFRELLRQKRYRYVSPGYLIAADDTVIGLSSLALVNNPNLPLDAPALHAEQAHAAAEQAVDAAIRNGWIAPRARDYHIGAIARHAGGVAQGIEAFTAFLNAEFGAQVNRHAAALTVPHGYMARGRRLALHAEIAHTARTEDISYRDALVRRPGTVGVDLNAKTAYERLLGEIERALGDVSQIPAEGLMGRARKALEIAKTLAMAERWRPAFTAIMEAREAHRAIEAMYEGYPRKAERLLQQPEPSIERFTMTASEMGEAATARY